MTTKQICHMEMRENAVREWVQDSYLQILHVPSRINPADIFTKEMRDGAHFWHLRDSFMCPLSLSSAVSFRCSSLLPAGRAPPTAVYTVRGFFVCVYQQGFVSFGIMLLSIILDPGGYFTSFQCQPSYHPVASFSCTFRTDMNF
jgi:hypothetical protein